MVGKWPRALCEEGTRMGEAPSECSLDIGQGITEAYHHLVPVLTGFLVPCYSFSFWGKLSPSNSCPGKEKPVSGEGLSVGKSYAKVPGDLGLA